MEIRDSGGGSGYSVAGVIRPPPPEERLAFLRTLQRVLKEGDFTATYKFALLQALLDIAVESRIRNDAELQVSYRQLAERFVEYYWGHAEPYRPGMEGGGVLAQSAGKQAAVLRLIAEVRGHNCSRTLAQLRRDSHYPALLSRVAKVIQRAARPLHPEPEWGPYRVPVRAGAGRQRHRVEARCRVVSAGVL